MKSQDQNCSAQKQENQIIKIKNVKQKIVAATAKCNKGSDKPQLVNKTVYTITVDWLEMVLTGKIPELENGEETVSFYNDMTLIRNKKEIHPAFYYGYSIMIKGKIFGTLFYRSNKTYRFSEYVTCQMRIKNERLYEKQYKSNLMEMLEIMNLKVAYFYRIDVAIDGYGILERISQLLSSKRFKPLRKVKVPVDFNAYNKEFETVKLGSRSSDNQVSIYKKSKYKDKPYIEQYWKNNNLNDAEKEVSRLELRMRSKSLKNVAININELENPNYLSSLAKSKIESWITFTNISGPHKKREQVIDWSFFNSVKILKPVSLKSHRTTLQVKKALKILIKEYYWDITIGGNDSLNPIIQLVHHFNLEKWFAAKLTSEWRQDLHFLTREGFIDYMNSFKIEEGLEQ